MGAISDHAASNAKPLPGSAHLNFTMAGLMGVGGFAGYFKAKSMPSLIAGVACCSLYGGAGYLIKEGDNTNGHGVASLASLALVGGMGPRAVKGGGAPALITTVLGLVAGAYNSKKCFDWYDSE